MHSCLLEHEQCAYIMKSETASTQWVTVDYNSKMKKKRPLNRDLNLHPSVGQSSANRK